MDPSPSPTPAKIWDVDRYQQRHAYVFKYGEAVLGLLDPKPGERILDLGCGAGQLTAALVDKGCEVIGIDRSPDMIAQARENFPHLDVRVGDATNFELDCPVDAVFSNATLHWVKDARAAIRCIWTALKPGGRFVTEFGGYRNVQSVVDAARALLGPLETAWFNPTIGQYATLLEAQGFEVRQAMWFDRPTRVEGEDAMEDWIKMFGDGLLSGVEESRRPEVRRAMVEKLRPTAYRDGGWTVDYRRLRVVAVKPVHGA